MCAYLIHVKLGLDSCRLKERRGGSIDDQRRALV